jgi:hypothetical protein
MRGYLRLVSCGRDHPVSVQEGIAHSEEVAGALAGFDAEPDETPDVLRRMPLQVFDRPAGQGQWSLPSTFTARTSAKELKVRQARGIAQRKVARPTANMVFADRWLCVSR